MSLFDRLQDEINADENEEGISPVDLLDLSPELAQVIKKIIRQNGMKLADIVTELEQDPASIQAKLDELEKRSFVRRITVKDQVWYKARFARKRGRTLSTDFWSALDSVVAKESSDDPSDD